MSAIQQLLTEHIDIWTAAETEKKLGRGRAAGDGATVYGIKKMRELILELAVQGRLIPRNRSWENLRLSDLGSWAIGSGFPTLEQGCQNEDILFVKVSDMNLAGNEKFIYLANNTISEVTASRLRINVHFSGTVIFPKIGGAIATNKRRILTRPTAIDNNCLGLTPKSGVSSAWLYLILSSIDLSKYQAGTSVPALAQGVLKDIPVLLPDSAEQDLVVAKVDELMALCDQLEAQHIDAADAHEQLVSHLLGTLTQSQSDHEFAYNWERISTHFDTLFTTELSVELLRQTLLQLAVMGKLVPSDGSRAAVEKMLDDHEEPCYEDIHAPGTRGFNRPPIENVPFRLLNTWKWEKLGSLILDLRYGTSVKCSYDPQNGIPVLRIPNVVGDIVSTSDMKYGPLSSDEQHKLRLNVGDALLIRSNGSASIVGKTALITKEVAHCSFAGYLVRIRLNTHLILPDYFQLVMKTPHVRASIELPIRTTSGVKNINTTEISSLLIPLPPLTEQCAIVKKLNELLSVCAELSERIANLSTIQQAFAKAIIERTYA